MNEIQFNARLAASKNGSSVQQAPAATLTMAGSQMFQGTQIIGTGGWTAISLGNLAGTPAKLMISNLDTVNYVQLAEDNAGVHLQDKLLPTDFVLRSPVGTIYAKANTAACLISITAMDA